MVWVIFEPFRTWSKIKKLKILRFQSTCHYNWRGQHICQRGDIPSSNLPIFGLVHNMGHFAPFLLGTCASLQSLLLLLLDFPYIIILKNQLC